MGVRTTVKMNETLSKLPGMGSDSKMRGRCPEKLAIGFANTSVARSLTSVIGTASSC